MLIRESFDVHSGLPFAGVGGELWRISGVICWTGSFFGCLPSSLSTRHVLGF
ncbi:MAG: hypothetical protein QOC62_3966 [Mycobacterium sp.]|jgi:hypothetical protein|nr:hypothetical protein [Mycobacterium sp.]